MTLQPRHPPARGRASPVAQRPATTRIRELIVTLELAPGSLVSERELMERLGLGRTPVREALRDARAEKLVEVYPRRGIVVSPVDVGDLAGALRGAARRSRASRRRLAAERATDGRPRRSRGARSRELAGGAAARATSAR